MCSLLIVFQFLLTQFANQFLGSNQLLLSGFHVFQGHFALVRGIKVVIALGIHLFPFRTEKLSPTTSMVLRKSGRVDSRRFLGVRAKVLREGSRFSFESAFFVSDSP